MVVRLFDQETESSTFKFCNDLVRFRTEERFQFIDLTELVRERVRRSGVVYGLVNIHTKHTTAAIVVNENEPLLLKDFRALLERWAPRHAVYRHNDLEAREFQAPVGERPNGHAHGQALVLGVSETLNIVAGTLQLGEWQRIFLVELDGVRTRSVSIIVLGISSGGEEGS